MSKAIVRQRKRHGEQRGTGACYREDASFSECRYLKIYDQMRAATTIGDTTCSAMSRVTYTAMITGMAEDLMY